MFLFVSKKYLSSDCENTIDTLRERQDVYLSGRWSAHPEKPIETKRQKRSRSTTNLASSLIFLGLRDRC